MSAETSIPWTRKVWNPTTGCSKKSPGCQYCYAERFSLQHGWTHLPWTAANSGENVALHPERLTEPLRWRPTIVFVNSMGDLFHPRVPIEFIAKVWNIMASATTECGKRHQHVEECWTGRPHLYQILTKYTGRMKQVVEDLPRYVGENWPGDTTLSMALEYGAWPLPNVMLGASVEDPKRAAERIPDLRQTPAAVRFLSLEPLLAPIVFGRLDAPDPFEWFLEDIDWVLIGGESGPKARLMELEWARDIISACRATGTPVFMKQLGSAARKLRGLKHPRGENPSEWPEDLRVREWPVQALPYLKEASR